MRYIARHYVRVGQARYTPGEMLNLEDRETALSMIRRGALETVETAKKLRQRKRRKRPKKRKRTRRKSGRRTSRRTST